MSAIILHPVTTKASLQASRLTRYARKVLAQSAVIARNALIVVGNAREVWLPALPITAHPFILPLQARLITIYALKVLAHALKVPAHALKVPAHALKVLAHALMLLAHARQVAAAPIVFLKPNS